MHVVPLSPPNTKPLLLSTFKYRAQLKYDTYNLSNQTLTLHLQILISMLCSSSAVSEYKIYQDKYKIWKDTVEYNFMYIHEREKISNFKLKKKNLKTGKLYRIDIISNYIARECHRIKYAYN